MPKLPPLLGEAQGFTKAAIDLPPHRRLGSIGIDDIKEAPEITEPENRMDRPEAG